MNFQPRSDLTRDQKLEAIGLLEEIKRRRAGRKLDTYFPDAGPLRRELYAKHLEFFKAGSVHRERLFLAANRIGKTEGAGGYETTLHLTGQYPHWWDGRRFDKPIKAWMAGKTNETARDILQAKMFGPIAFHDGRKGFSGSGLVPADTLDDCSWRQGVSDLMDTIKIRHVSGGYSTLSLKSYQQGRGSFEGTEQDLVWMDEEPPIEIYTECLIRTMTTDGLIILTFTPLEGMSEVVMSYLNTDSARGS